MPTINFKLDGLTCEACVKLATRYLQKIDGVSLVKVGLDGKAEIRADRPIDKTEVEKALADSDYRVI